MKLFITQKYDLQIIITCCYIIIIIIIIIYPSPNNERNRCFLVALNSLILKRPCLEVVTKKFFISRHSFSAMSHMEMCCDSHFWWYVYFWGLWVSFVTTDQFSVRATKITSRIGGLGKWLYYQKYVNQTTLNHATL